MIRRGNAITTNAVLPLALARNAPCVRAQSVAVSSIAPPSAIKDFTPVGTPPGGLVCDRRFDLDDRPPFPWERPLVEHPKG